MHMEWALRGPGWALFTWDVTDSRIKIHTTYLADGLASVLEMAADLALGGL
jgi:hypothetical protein